MAASLDRITPDNGISSEDEITNTGAITLVGRASPGEIVRVFRDGVGQVGTATAAPSGTWTYDATPLGLLPGVHRFAVLGSDGGHLSATLAVSIDILPPAAPTIVGHAVAGVTQVTTPRISRLSTIAIMGACETSPRVRLNVDGQPTTAIASPDVFGSWSIPIGAGDGHRAFTAVAMDAAGNVSEASAPFRVFFDTVVPAAPRINSVSPQTAPGRVQTAQFTLQGMAEPSSVVQVFQGGRAVGTTPVDAAGAWSFPAASLALGEGVYTFTAVTWDGVGNSSPPSSPFQVTFDALAPAAPVITSLQRDGSTPGFNFVVAGRADPGSRVSIEQAGVGVVGQVAASASGEWAFTHRGAQLAEGAFRYTARARDGGGQSPPSAAELYKPNIVLVNLDDVRADELRYMPFVHQHLAGAGTVFNNSFAPTSLSGPSRASLLSGLYAHNTGVLGNAPPMGGILNGEDESTLPVWLQAEGYRTGLFGKHETLRNDLSSRPALTVPPGWNEFSSRHGGSLYFDMTLNVNGREVQLGSNPEDYATDVWARQGVDFIDSTNQAGDQPLFMYFAPFAGHYPYTPAPRHVGAYSFVEVARPPSFNVAPEGFDSLTPDRIASAVVQLRPHLESLLAVDDAVASFYARLSASGELDNTIFMVTADNGYMWGEHAVLNDKNYFYDESIRVPLVVFDGRAPGNRTNSNLVANIDLAPTIADYAGATVPYSPDGVSLKRAVYDPSVSVRNDLLLESWWAPPMWRQLQGFGPWGAGVRTAQWKYNEFAAGRTELFDLVNDPYELNNLAASPAHATIRQQLAARLDELRPADRSGPAVSNLDLWHVIDSEGNARLRVFGVADDAGRGGSQLGSPEYFIDRVDQLFSGRPAVSVDGGFDASREGFVADIPAAELAKLRPGTHRLWVRGRDVYGNFGEAVSISFVVGAAPQMRPQSDTGLAGDGMTVLDTLQWVATAPAGYTLRGFAVNEWGQTFRLTASGSQVVDLSATLPHGKYQVFTVADSPGRDPIVSAASNAQIVGISRNNGMLHILGTSGDDQILVTDQAVANRLAVFFSGVLAGTYPPRSRVTIHGLDGNDVINAVGDFDAFLMGDSGNDILIGGSGNDRLDGGQGDNNLHGNDGNDTYVVRRLLPFPADKGPELSVDRVWEWAGNGDDELLFLDFGGTVLPGRLPLVIGEFRGPSGLFTRRVSHGDAAARELETIDLNRPMRSANAEELAEEAVELLLDTPFEQESLDSMDD